MFLHAFRNDELTFMITQYTMTLRRHLMDITLTSFDAEIYQS